MLRVCRCETLLLGETLNELLKLPENAHARKQVRMRICKETVKSITLRIDKYLKLASNIELSPFDAVALLEKEFGKGVFSNVPMMRSIWNERRAAAGDVYMKKVMVLQRAISVRVVCILPPLTFCSHSFAHESARQTANARRRFTR